MKIFIIAETPQAARSLRIAQASWRSALGLPVPEYVEISSVHHMRGMSINPDRVIFSPTFHRIGEKSYRDGEDILAYLSHCVDAWSRTHG